MSKLWFFGGAKRISSTIKCSNSYKYFWTSSTNRFKCYRSIHTCPLHTYRTRTCFSFASVQVPLYRWCHRALTSFSVDHRRELQFRRSSHRRSVLAEGNSWFAVWLDLLAFSRDVHSLVWFSGSCSWFWGPFDSGNTRSQSRLASGEWAAYLAFGEGRPETTICRKIWCCRLATDDCWWFRIRFLSVCFTDE